MNTATPRRPLVIVIEGNISSGKTTVLETLESKGFLCYLENIAEWNDYLEEMYNGDLKTSDMLQMRIAVDQLQVKNTIERHGVSPDFTTLANGRRVVFIERWADSSEHIFIKNALNSEHLTITAKGKKLWEDLVTTSGLKQFKIDAIMYIQSSPNVSYDRIMQRAKTRRSERNIPLQYIESLHMLYDTHMLHHARCPVCVIENTNALSKHDFAEKATKQILDYCASLTDA